MNTAKLSGPRSPATLSGPRSPATLSGAGSPATLSGAGSPACRSVRVRPGFTFTELLCVLALLAVIGVIMSLLLRETLDVERVQTAGFEQMLQRNALADQFRADVAQAEKALPAWREYKSGADTLILQKSTDSHVVYRWHEGSLKRKSFAGKQESERELPVGVKESRVEFLEAGSKLIRLRVRTLRDGKAVPGRTVEIAAALGGDVP